MTENSGGLLLDGQAAGTEYSVLHQGSSTQAELENSLQFQPISRGPGPLQPQPHAQAESFPLPSSQASLEGTGLLLPRHHSSPGIGVRESGANGFQDTSEASYSQGDGYEEHLTGLGTSLYDDDTYTAADAGQSGPRNSHDYASISQQLADEAAAAGTSRVLDRGQRVELTRVPVICNGNRGVFVVERQVIVCLCRSCVSRAAMDGLPEMELSPTDFERHSGSCTSKKWKYTVKVFDEDEGGPTISVGAWLEKNAPMMAKSRIARGYSSIFGDVAPTQVKIQSSRRSSGKRSRPSNGRWRNSAGRSASQTPPNSKPTSSPEDGDGGRELTPVGGFTAADLTSPSGKKWLAAADGKSEMQLPRPAMREGPQYQAEIPEPLGPRPLGVEADDPRAGTPGPSTLEALALAAGYEKQASDSLHIDAVADPEYHPGAEHDVRNLMVERGQRTRRRPTWLDNTIDPKEANRSVQGHNPRVPVSVYAEPSSEEEQEDVEDDFGPLSWRAKQRTKRSGGYLDGGREHKRMRSLNTLSNRPSRTDRGGLVRADSSAPPRVIQWQVLGDGLMRVMLVSQGQVFQGALMPQPREAKVEMVEEPQPDSAYRRSASRAQRPDSSESGGWGDGRASCGWNDAAAGTAGTEGCITGTSEGPEVESLRGAAHGGPPVNPSQKGNANRRAIANRDYGRMAAQGPPPDARCAMCHLMADPACGSAFRTEDSAADDDETLERAPHGLGPFLLVKVSAIMNAWVHMQCALWSPEVYVGLSGTVERTSEAVRRGRMIKCKLCGEKGATLGCHKRSCRASFHLPCARDHGCLLHGVGDEPYLVTCPEHKEVRDEAELVAPMQVQPDQKVRISPPVDVPTRPRNLRTEVLSDDLFPPRRQVHGEGSLQSHRTFPGSMHSFGAPGGRANAWQSMPRMASSLDTLSAAALAAKSSKDSEAVANPLAAQHFGGTVGQSVLRPGRCAVCVVQRKGVCGTQTAPKKCLRRIALTAAGREIPDAPPGWRTRRPVAHWPAQPPGPGEEPGRSEGSPRRSSGTQRLQGR